MSPERGVVSIPLLGGLGNQLFGATFGLYLHVRYEVRTEYRYPPHGLGNLSHGDIAIEDFQSFDRSVANLLLENRLDALLRRGGHVLFENKGWSFPFIPRFYSEPKLISKLEDPSVKEGRLMVAGYFQDRKYLDYLQDRQLLHLLLPRRLSRKAAQVASDVSKPDTYAVHIRRGDYLLKSVAGALSLDYYISALTEMGAGPESTVYVFTDSLEHVREEFSRQEPGFRIVLDCSVGLSPAESLYALSRSRAMVASKSTFSWWAASTGNLGKRVVFPSGWNTHLVSEKWITRSTDGFTI